MFAKLSAKSSVDKILVMSLTNLGDVILTCPVVDVLLETYPHAKITLIVGPKGPALFAGHPRIEALVYDKHSSPLSQLRWFSQLRRRKFDAVIDLRNTALTVFFAAKYGTHPLIHVSKEPHLKEQHLNRLRSAFKGDLPKAEALSIKIYDEDLKACQTHVWDKLRSKEYVLMAPGAADSAKRWDPLGFAQVANKIALHGLDIVVVGGKEEHELIETIKKNTQAKLIIAEGVLNLRQMVPIINKAKLVIAHDSGLMHLASYLNRPVVGLWGPTDHTKSHPWSDQWWVIVRNENCARCKNRRLTNVRHTCMSAITTEEVINTVEEALKVV